MPKLKLADIFNKNFQQAQQKAGYTPEHEKLMNALYKIADELTAAGWPIEFDNSLRDGCCVPTFKITDPATHTSSTWAIRFVKGDLSPAPFLSLQHIETGAPLNKRIPGYNLIYPHEVLYFIRDLATALAQKVERDELGRKTLRKPKNSQ